MTTHSLRADVLSFQNKQTSDEILNQRFWHVFAAFAKEQHGKQVFQSHALDVLATLVLLNHKADTKDSRSDNYYKGGKYHCGKRQLAFCPELSDVINAYARISEVCDPSEIYNLDKLNFSTLTLDDLIGWLSGSLVKPNTYTYEQRMFRLYQLDGSISDPVSPRTPVAARIRDESGKFTYFTCLNGFNELLIATTDPTFEYLYL